ncbi:hypothetical protein P687_3255 [Acinetobacter baumannii UH9907]|uniref:hypothetical protein n=1 Tax=Acinetobacter baumannii TaxID=470 RepID=UPI0003DF1E98|nr:hypothetical protein [Acinetobacter baumannii]ETR53389.1 hypothetical protein P687_3255 [Acinetobacter baumannii UH9907]KHZ32121.2 hypothetical protein RQ11_17185 [Acinetobacter baumannii]
MKILNKVEAKLAWANGELLLVNNTERNGWEPFNPYDFGFDVFDKFEFQLKPRTIFIGEFEVPEPLKEAPAKGSTCSYPSPTVELGVQQFKWNGSKGQLRMLQHGQVHSSFDNAFAHCCAIIKVSGGEFAEDMLKLLNKPTDEVEEEKPLENEVEKSPQVNTEKTVIEEPTKDLKEDLDSAIVVTEESYVSSSEDLLVPETNEPKVDPEYQQTLDTLLQRVKESKTPAEVNAVYRYTRTWDDEQMKPILLATHKRLEELEKEKASANEPPSLMVLIQTAPDLTTLDALEIDVAARDPQIQPKLMGYVRKRRYELENPTPTQQESTPDYLLVDGF